jgi:RNA polymerase sigma factor (sigma-70 family)
LTDSELINSCQRQDKKAQEILFLQYSDRMFRLTTRYVSVEDAQDCVVMAFTKIFRSIGGFKDLGTGSLESWMRRIVINEALMWLRRNHNFNLTERIEPANAECDVTELSDLEADEILLMVGTLPLGYRTTFSLAVIEGYSHSEISQLLGISESTSRSQLFKAKSMLKKMLIKGGYQYGT